MTKKYEYSKPDESTGFRVARKPVTTKVHKGGDEKWYQ